MIIALILIISGLILLIKGADFFLTGVPWPV